MGGKDDGLEKEEGKVEDVVKEGEKEGAEEKETENTAGFGNIEAELGTENPWNQSINQLIKKNQMINKLKNTERSTNKPIAVLSVNEKNCY